MKFNTLAFFVFCVLVGAVNTSRATVTMNILLAAELYEADGTTLAPYTSLILLVADTTGNGFANLQPGADVSLGTLQTNNMGVPSIFVDGSDDLIVGRWQLGANLGDNGYFAGVSGPIGLSGNWNAGDALAVLWFPTLTTSSTTAPASTTYGKFLGVPVLDGSDPWITPSDGGTINLIFQTTAAGGSQSNSLGTASYTIGAPIPEPSRLVLLGLGGLGVFFRRRRC